jgi:hypothetical protein
MQWAQNYKHSGESQFVEQLLQPERRQRDSGAASWLAKAVGGQRGSREQKEESGPPHPTGRLGRARTEDVDDGPLSAAKPIRTHDAGGATLAGGRQSRVLRTTTLSTGVQGGSWWTAYA